MKLTEDNIILNNTPPITSTSITISHGDAKQNAEQLKQQILDDQEKVEKYDEIDEHNKILRMRIGDRVIEIQNLSHTIETLAKDNQRLEQENKQLKEDLELYHTHDDELLKLVSTHTLISIEELSNLKKKLEKIEELVQRNRIEFGVNHYDKSLSRIEKILEEDNR